MTDGEDGRTWVVVADFLVTVIAIFVIIYAGSQQKDPVLLERVDAIKKILEQSIVTGVIREFAASDREITIVYSDQQLGFPDCGWAIEASTAAQIRQHMELFADVEEYVNLLQIEGHADIRPPSSCTGLKFRTNFELSQTRAMSVFAALLDKPMEELDTIVTSASTASLESLVGRLAAKQQVLVAGFGATRPVPGAAPEDRRHRRVEVRVTFTDRP